MEPMAALWHTQRVAARKWLEANAALLGAIGFLVANERTQPNFTARSHHEQRWTRRFDVVQLDNRLLVALPELAVEALLDVCASVCARRFDVAQLDNRLLVALPELAVEALLDVCALVRTGLLRRPPARSMRSEHTTHGRHFLLCGVCGVRRMRFFLGVAHE